MFIADLLDAFEVLFYAFFDLGGHVFALDETFDLTLEGKSEKVLVKEVQYDHLGLDVLHVDFARVSLDEKVKVIVPLELRGKPKGEAFEASVAFANLRGDLPQPVEGSLALGFGEHLHPRFHTKTMQSGLLITAAGGARVAAVADGKVVFADYYQSYGPMVILDHGSGWFTLYMHLLGLGVAKGQVLKAGEALGAVGDTVDGPRLGFEIRHQAQPQDPQKWLKRKYR